jgi:hypothetical protein
MKLKLLVSTCLLAVLLPAVSSLAQTGAKSAAPRTDSEIIADARARYPLKTCLVSNEPLGSMGDAFAYIHRATGQPDRVLFLCCEGCVDDFKADPAKFLKKLDDAAKSKPAAGKKSQG